MSFLSVGRWRKFDCGCRLIERSLDLLIRYDDGGFLGCFVGSARAVWLTGEFEATAWRSSILAEEKDVKNNSKERILIADDDRDFRQILVRRAERMGLLVVEAEDGQQADNRGRGDLESDE